MKSGLSLFTMSIFLSAFSLAVVQSICPSTNQVGFVPQRSHVVGMTNLSSPKRSSAFQKPGSRTAGGQDEIDLLENRKSQPFQPLPFTQLSWYLIQGTNVFIFIICILCKYFYSHFAKKKSEAMGEMPRISKLASFPLVFLPLPPPSQVTCTIGKCAACALPSLLV